VLNGFSAYADQKDLVEFVDGARDRGGKLRRVILVHGEPGPQKVVADLLRSKGVPHVDAPASGEHIEL
jgi:metallo-beta-lactamase family protein